MLISSCPRGGRWSRSQSRASAPNIRVSGGNFPAFPIASITGQGRVFFEQGGYRDTTTYLDRLLDQAKNRPVLVWGFLILSGLSMISWVLDLLGLIKD